ncbi:hypothetical protein ACP70R_030205 [Stipagrostis hirtigluma subsp. patula]
MAATSQLPPPRAGLCAFMRLCVRVPARSRTIFVQLFTLAAGTSTALYLCKSAALQPIAAAVNSEAAVGRDAAFPTIVRAFMSDHMWHLLAGAGCLVASGVLGSAIKITTVFAAVSSCSHGHQDHTLASLLGTVKRNAWGPIATASLGYVLQVACVAATVVSAAPLFILGESYSPLMIMLHLLLLFLALLFYLYLEVVCAVALVASAAEPGLRGMGAVRRAWRLVRGSNAQVALYMAATWALGRAISPLYNVAIVCLPHSATTVLWVDAAVMYSLLAALDVFSVAAVTAAALTGELNDNGILLYGHDFVLDHLRFIKVVNFHGTRCELQLLVFLMKRAPALEDVVLVTAEAEGAPGDEWLKIMQGRLSAMPMKASPEARVAVCRPSGDDSRKPAHGRFYHEE